MLQPCKSYIVAVHLLLLFHIAHTFVLLTANVEDFKNIARKFVSNELAEKIADFLARATETLSQQVPKAEENIKDNSQVSAENKMYKIERHGFGGSPKVDEKLIGRNAVKHKPKTYTENKDPFEADYTDKTSKPKKETKGKSRYIIESNQQTTNTGNADSKSSEEDNDYKMKDSSKMISNQILGVPNKGKNKKPTSKKRTKVKPYKLLSTYDTDEANDVKDGATDSKEKKDNKYERSQRAFEEEIAAIRNAALEYNDDGKKRTTKYLLEEEEPDKQGNEITEKSEKAADTNYFETGKNVREEKWWEKDLPKRNQENDVNLKRKTWF